MNLKDKTNRITLRLNDKQFNFVKASADILGVSPSEFLRMVVNASMVSAKDSKFKEVFGRENDKTNSDN
jgi:predicted DNA binding CopG/RHH family protein